jgi:hypothetical protein
MVVGRVYEICLFKGEESLLVSGLLSNTLISQVSKYDLSSSGSLLAHEYVGAMDVQAPPFAGLQILLIHCRNFATYRPAYALDTTLMAAMITAKAKFLRLAGSLREVGLE